MKRPVGPQWHVPHAMPEAHIVYGIIEDLRSTAQTQNASEARRRHDPHSTGSTSTPTGTSALNRQRRLTSATRSNGRYLPRTLRRLAAAAAVAHARSRTTRGARHRSARASSNGILRRRPVRRRPHRRPRRGHRSLIRCYLRRGGGPTCAGARCARYARGSPASTGGGRTASAPTRPSLSASSPRAASWAH